MEWSLNSEDGTPVINMTCRENASAVYDWNNGEETAVDPAPNTSLWNPFDVVVVSGFSLDSMPTFTQNFDRVYKIRASWDLSDDQYVLSGGWYEIEYKASADSTYISAGRVDGSVTEMELTVLKPDTLYDVRIYAYNRLGVRSQPTTLTGFLVGTSITTNTEDWENETLPRNNTDWENDTATSEDWEL